jgi:predicted DNA binding CopG/RHH family protein
MKKRIRYRDEAIGDVRPVTDFLPSPADLALRNQQTKVTLSLSTESVAFFKEAAARHGTQYQKMIRQLLDDYVARQKQPGREDTPRGR